MPKRWNVFEFRNKWSAMFIGSFVKHRKIDVVSTWWCQKSFRWYVYKSMNWKRKDVYEGGYDRPNSKWDIQYLKGLDLKRYLKCRKTMWAFETRIFFSINYFSVIIECIVSKRWHHFINFLAFWPLNKSQIWSTSKPA